VDSQANRPTVLVLATGGTIAMGASAAGTDAAHRLAGADLLAGVPGLAESGIDVRVRDVAAVPGASLRRSHLVEIARLAREAGAGNVAGVVVTQGTDTIEESSYYLDLVHDALLPIVVTGAMRNPSLAGTDAPANLLNAVQVAASASARGLGCVVAFGGEVHEGRWVRKAHTVSPAAFVSPDVGPLGLVVEGRFRLLRGRSGRRVTLPAADRDDLRVPIVPLALGDDGALLRAAADLGAAGLVVAAMGAGHAPEWTVPVLADIAAAMPVVLASRAGAGPVLARMYGFPGSERDLLGRGLISAAFLHPLKARILLHLLLAAGHDSAGIADAFALAGDPP
jgi:L-asparaginase